MSAEEKTTVATDVANPPSREHEIVHGDESNVDVPLDLPAGWKYRQISLFGYKMPWYASPRVQLLMVAFVCFMCPGMFNALGGLGGGGRASATLADNMVSHANNPPPAPSHVLADTARIRTPPSTAHLLSSDSLVAPSLTNSVLNGHSLSVVSAMVSTPSACWFPSIRPNRVSAFSLVPSSVSVPVFYGLLRAPS